MIKVVGISFENNKQIYYFDPKDLDLRKNVTVIVKTKSGMQFGRVEIPPFMIEEKKLHDVLKEVVRISTKKDYIDYKKNNLDAQKALEKCNKIIEKLNLNMQVLDANFTFDRNQLLFRFISDSRVDFRELAKELANIYKTRIELRQIGARDKAKEVGGCGLCGCPLCCQRFNSDISSVSINMAKNQNISLNPEKINGLCGRLMCCLRYEDETYKKLKKDLPKIGSVVETEKGTGKVKSVNILKGTYVVEVKDEGMIEIGSN